MENKVDVRFISIDTRTEEGIKTAQELINCLGSGYTILHAISAGDGLVYYIVTKENYEI